MCDIKKKLKKKKEIDKFTIIAWDFNIPLLAVGGINGQKKLIET